MTDLTAVKMWDHGQEVIQNRSNINRLMEPTETANNGLLDIQKHDAQGAGESGAGTVAVDRGRIGTMGAFAPCV